MDSTFDDDDIVPVSDLEAEETSLRELESRIDKLREPAGGNKVFARGVALVTSMGFILAGCLVGGFFMGDFLAKKTGYPVFQLFGLLVGLAAAILALVKLMKPFFKSEE